MNFGHFGHSHSGRERFALGFPSIAVRPVGACPCSTHVLQRREAVDLRVERTEAVAEAGNHVEAHEAVDTGLAELLHLSLVIELRVVRRDEVVGRAVREDDLAALRLERSRGSRR